MFPRLPRKAERILTENAVMPSSLWIAQLELNIVEKIMEILNEAKYLYISSKALNSRLILGSFALKQREFVKRNG